MSKYLEQYEFEKPPKSIEYMEGEPLKLHKEFGFYHNKNTFRKHLTDLQNLTKDYLKVALMAPGIRDSFLKEEYFEKYLLVIFTDVHTYKEINQFIAKIDDNPIEEGCFRIVTTSKYMLLLAKDTEGIKKGIDAMKTILEQTLNDYFKKKEFDDYIQIRQFSMYSC